MGNSKYLANLNKGERQTLINKLWTQQNHKCFICGKDIDLDLQPVDKGKSTKNCIQFW